MKRLLGGVAAIGLALSLPAPASALADPPPWCDPAYAVRSGSGWLCLGPPATEAAPEAPARIAGDSRYATAAAISATFWQPGQATTVYLANGDGIDAVAAGASVDGPVLLVGTGDNVPAVTLAEIQRLAPVAVVGLGGPGAVTDAQLAAAVAAGQ